MSNSIPFMVPNPEISCKSIASQKYLNLCDEEIILKKTDYATYHKGLRGVSCDLYLTNLRIVACKNMGSWMKIAVSPALALMDANNAPKISCQILLHDIDHIKIKRQLLVKKLVPITKSGNESFGFIPLKMEEWKSTLRNLSFHIV